MKFVIDIEEFYLEEGELAGELKKYVVNSVVSAIWEKIQEQVDTSITVAVKATVSSELALRINETIGALVQKEVIVIDKKEVPIAQFIRERFMDRSGWSNPTSTIDGIANKFADEMKRRYDIAFATQIVRRMNENGLLKEEGITKLMEPATEKK